MKMAWRAIGFCPCQNGPAVDFSYSAWYSKGFYMTHGLPLTGRLLKCSARM